MYEYENEHRPVENQQSYAYNFSPEPPVHQPEQHPQKKRGGAGKVVALLLACALVGGASGVGASLLTGSRQTTAQTETAAQSEASANGTTLFEGQRETEALTVAHVDTSRELTAAEVYAENVNSTVGITTSITTNYWGYQTQSAAAGSGFILTADGYILTNYHVVEDSNSITVSLYDGSSYDAKLIGYDENNDIAVLKIDATGLQPVVLGSSDDLHVGDQVVVTMGTWIARTCPVSPSSSTASATPTASGSLNPTSTLISGCSCSSRSAASFACSASVGTFTT